MSNRQATLRGHKAVVLIAWSALGLGGAATEGRYSIPAIWLMVIGTVLLLLVTLGGKTSIPRWTREATTVALASAVAAATVLPAGIYGTGAPLFLSRALTLTATMLVFASWWLLPRFLTPVVYVSILLMAGAGVAMIVSSPKPPIDVWYMLQAASHGLSHGQNIYTVRYTSGVPGEFTNAFAYLPGSALLLWPFHVIFGDVRYGLLAAVVATALLMVRFGRPGLGRVAGCLILVYPRGMFGIEQSWVDPLLLLTICAMVVAVVRGRRGWAVIAFVLCLFCKQQAWILVPLAALWKEFGWRRTLASAGGALALMVPWAVAAPHAFFGPTLFQAREPAQATSNSLSLYVTLLHHGINPGLGFTTLATLGAIALCGWRLPKSAFGFCLSAAIAEAVFNLTSKQPHFNEWELAAGLALLAIAFGKVRSVYDQPDVTTHQVAGSDEASSRYQPDVVDTGLSHLADGGGGSHVLQLSTGPPGKPEAPLPNS
jgi:hypothetical protein